MSATLRSDVFEAREVAAAVSARWILILRRGWRVPWRRRVGILMSAILRSDVFEALEAAAAVSARWFLILRRRWRAPWRRRGWRRWIRFYPEEC